MNTSDRGPTRCTYSIEKDWPGHCAVLSRRQCKRMTTDESGRCWQHPKAARMREDLLGPEEKRER